ncbi:ABC transporter substrate-binding protein [Bacteriovorax sp. Seq25_V]|uniref:substrate-binding periplasmic protein n=1 Tax=Bacteriovorax sp. Seq25_V TaxID=1201288 RepID=UPI00038A0858|nr:transporter substrate-binding domain-containing protein [Bacteriovorax sp. Seq25_V]EQC44398.1 ABC transporter, substrate-binding protein, family 3 [Bacteriovorax sp. Seq25_V]
MWKTILFSSLLSNFSYGSAGRIKFIYDNYCPWSCLVKDGDQHSGFAVDLVKMIYAGDWQIDFSSSSFQRAIKEVESGRSDIIPAVYKNNDRNLIYSLPISTTNISVAIKSDNIRKLDFSKGLHPLKVGVAKGFVYSKAIADYQKRYPDLTSVVSTTSAVGQLLKMIDAGRIDLMTDNHEVLVFWRDYYKLKGIEIATAPSYLSYQKEIFLAFTSSDKGRKLRDRFNEKLLKMKENGELQKLKDRYSIR